MKLIDDLTHREHMFLAEVKNIDNLPGAVGHRLIVFILCLYEAGGALTSD